LASTIDNFRATGAQNLAISQMTSYLDK